DGDTALLKAAGFGCLDVVRYLVAVCGADVNIANYRGHTALMRAETEQHADIVRYLAGECSGLTDANAAISTRTTALMIAALYGQVDVVQYPVTVCRANVNAANEDGYTAIRFAAERGHEVIQRFL
ncbi:hypothetical protein PHYSODRAFT_374363, partial [Phytophthora sojae]